MVRYPPIMQFHIITIIVFIIVISYHFYHLCNWRHDIANYPCYQQVIKVINNFIIYQKKNMLMISSSYH